MSRQAISVLIDEFIKTYLPKLDQLDTPTEKAVCARILKAALEDYIERNN
jgi:hypothetical protein